MNIGIVLSKDYTGKTAEYYERKHEDFNSKIFVIKEV